MELGESKKGKYNIFDGQGRHHDLKKLESLSSNEERLRMLYKYMDPMGRPANPGTMYPWHPLLDGLEKSDSSRMLDGSSSRKESMWDDDDDSSVDGELLNEYLERVGAEDLTNKEVEVNVDDDGLRKLDVDAYHSLSTLQKLNWITWQLLLGRYNTPLREPKPGPPPEHGQSAKGPWLMYSDEDQSDYGQSDYEEDPGEEESYYEDSDKDE